VAGISNVARRKNMLEVSRNKRTGHVQEGNQATHLLATSTVEPPVHVPLRTRVEESKRFACFDRSRQ
jgi:hypothetical protein